MNIDRRVNQMRRLGVILAFVAGCWIGVVMNAQADIHVKDTAQLKDETRLDETLVQKVKRIHLDTRSIGDFK